MISSGSLISHWNIFETVPVNNGDKTNESMNGHLLVNMVIYGINEAVTWKKYGLYIFVRFADYQSCLWE